jgi:cell division initiation protein
MPIRPIDIRRKEFRNGFRGYDANQVDDFLDAVADEFERSYTENQRMREEISSLRDRLQQFEDLEGSIRAALVHAEQAANDLRRAANKEAEDVRQSARREAEFTIREAQSRSHQMLADSSARIERVQESYEALQEAKRSFGNDFRHLLKTYMDMMENMEVSSAQEIEASLRQRLDTESIAVVHEAAAQEAARLPEEPDAEPAAEPDDAEPTAVGETRDQDLTVSGHEIVEPEAEQSAGADQAVVQDPGATQPIDVETAGAFREEAEAPAEDSPTDVLRLDHDQPQGPLADEPRAETEEREVAEPEAAEPEVAEPEVEPSTAQGQTAPEPSASEPDAAGEVEREEPALAEESSSQDFFDRDQPSQDRGDSRIFRASRFLRRRE